MAFAAIFTKFISSALFVTSLYWVWGYFTSPLKHIPGPFVAKFTNIWRMLDVYGGRNELTQIYLHEKYGQAVRVGPNTVSLSDPGLIRTIYSSRGEFVKSDFYTVNDVKVGKAIVKTAFGVQSNEVHAQMLRPIQKLYRLGNILDLEQRINDTIETFIRRLDETFVDGPNAGTVCDMASWLEYFAWDVIAQLTFGRGMGFIEAGKDHSGFLHTAEQALDYFGVIGQIPALDHWLGKNPIMAIGPPTFDAAADYCAQQSIARQQGTDGKAADERDMLDEFLRIKESDPAMMNDNTVIGCLLLNVLAGADTVAITLRAVVYYVLKHPKVYKSLQRELDAAGLSSPVAYKDATKLPYLDAVIREANRMHSGVGLLLERIVPVSGLTLSDGTVIPPGTIVGINPWVMNQNKPVYGEDASCFKPERWLQDEEEETAQEFESRLASMKQADLTFGAGNRVCLGRNIAMVEIYKITATLFSRYNMSLDNPEKEWHIQNSWFVRQEGIDVKMQRRR